MNNNGWGLNEFILMLSIIAIAFITVIFFSNQFKNKIAEKNLTMVINKENIVDNSIYNELEKKMIDAAINCDIKPPKNIKLNTLIEKSCISEIKDPKTGSKCSGYIQYNEETKNYTAYLSCPANYQTVGYNKNYE